MDVSISTDLDKSDLKLLVLTLLAYFSSQIATETSLKVSLGEKHKRHEQKDTLSWLLFALAHRWNAL